MFFDKSAPTGHPDEMPALLDGPSTAPVKRTKWVRVPPLALEDGGMIARLSEGAEALNLGRTGSTPALAAARPRR